MDFDQTNRLALPTLITDRLELRPLNPQSETDCLKLIQIYNDDFVGQFGFGKQGLDTTQKVVALCQDRQPKKHHCTKLSPTQEPPASSIHLVYLKSTEEHIGLAFIYFRKDLPYPDIGYAFFQQFTGKGYGPEAALVVKEWWQKEIGVEEIMITIYDYNVASQRVARKIGFVEGGTLTFVYDDGSQQKATAFVLPTMRWPEGEIVINISKAQ